MLIRLTPEQVEEGWDTFAPVLETALPSYMAATRTAMTNILRSILVEESDIWIYKKDGETKAVVMTSFYQDHVVNSLDLIIYALVVLDDSVSDEDWLEGIDTLRGYADKHECGNVLAFVENPIFKRKLERLGAEKVSLIMKLM